MRRLYILPLLPLLAILVLQFYIPLHVNAKDNFNIIYPVKITVYPQNKIGINMQLKGCEATLSSQGTYDSNGNIEVYIEAEGNTSEDMSNVFKVLSVNLVLSGKNVNEYTGTLKVSSVLTSASTVNINLDKFTVITNNKFYNVTLTGTASLTGHLLDELKDYLTNSTPTEIKEDLNPMGFGITNITYSQVNNNTWKFTISMSLPADEVKYKEVFSTPEIGGSFDVLKFIKTNNITVENLVLSYSLLGGHFKFKLHMSGETPKKQLTFNPYKFNNDLGKDYDFNVTVYPSSFKVTCDGKTGKGFIQTPIFSIEGENLTGTLYKVMKALDTVSPDPKVVLVPSDKSVTIEHTTISMGVLGKYKNLVKYSQSRSRTTTSQSPFFTTTTKLPHESKGGSSNAMVGDNANTTTITQTSSSNAMVGAGVVLAVIIVAVVAVAMKWR